MARVVAERAGHATAAARDRAEEAVAHIQGALVLSCALDDPPLLARRLARVEARLLDP